MAKSIADKLKDSGVEASRGTITYVDPAALTLITDKAHPLYDPRVEEPLDEAMLADIDKRGVLQPIICRDNGVANGRPIVQVIAGRRRTRHLIAVNESRRQAKQPPHKIPVTFVHGDDVEMLLIALAENAHRKDESVKSIAWKVSAVQKLGCSREEIAKACAMSERRVQSLFLFLNLHPKVQTAIDERSVPIGSIDALAEVPREEQEAMLEKLRGANATKNHEVRDAVKAIRNGHAYVAPDRKKAWGRKELKLLREELEFYDKNKEVKVALALVDFILGNTKPMAELETVPLAVTSVKRKLKRQMEKSR